jgi:hypothetical protein
MSDCRVSWDGRVTPADAALLLDVSSRALRRMRDERRGPPAVYRPLWGCAWSYEIHAIYEFILFNALGQSESRSRG